VIHCGVIRELNGNGKKDAELLTFIGKLYTQTSNSEIQNPNKPKEQEEMRKLQ